MAKLHELEDILEVCSTYLTRPESIKIIKDAYYYMENKHEGQLRKSGEAYKYHLIEVAYTLATFTVGPTTIAAGLLHDTVEDTNTSLEEIERLFGSDVAFLVDGATKIRKLGRGSYEDYQAENHRKIFIAMAKDLRVIIIKLADRLHNMRTLSYHRPEKQQMIAKETLEIYAPIAHRLGMNSVKSELEDLSLYYLERDKYNDIVEKLSKKQQDRQFIISEMEKTITNLLNQNKLPYRICGRAKSIYSIYKKMYIKDKQFNEIYDLQALRIITDTKSHCYEILGYIHATYRPIPGRFKDYIAMPKPNLYQSLHTTIMADNGEIFEVQIRTEEMDEIAEGGIAAHWRYKENIKYNPKQEQKEIEEKLYWLKDMVNMTEENDNDDAKAYVNTLTKDIFEANVYVMSPKGRVIDLPNGSTPIDFAYKIHTQVGHTMVGAVVNGTMVPLTYILKTGDVVDIKTNKNTGPSEDWLNIAKTNMAINHIRKYLAKQKELLNSDDAINKGKELFAIACKADNIDVNEALKLLSDEKYKRIRVYPTIEDLYLAIGNRHVSASNISSKVRSELKLKEKLETTKELLQKTKTVNKTISHGNNIGVKVEGIDKISIQMAQCCSPIPGDLIVGYISKGLGVKVHRKDCPNIAKETKRLINVFWDSGDNNNSILHTVYIQITATDRPNLLMEIINTFSQTKIMIQSINGNVNDKNSLAIFNLIIKVKDANQLMDVFNFVNNIPGVLNVERVTKN